MSATGHDGRLSDLTTCFELSRGAVKRLVLTHHASLKIAQRELDMIWLERTAREPQGTEQAPYRAEIQRRFRSIDEFGGRVLRVACVETASTIRVISVMFDRGAGRGR
jgi:hypothetical protein